MFFKTSTEWRRLPAAERIEDRYVVRVKTEIPNPDGRLRSARGALVWVLASAAGYAVWIAGMMRA